jgi:hypothetical protein
MLWYNDSRRETSNRPSEGAIVVVDPTGNKDYRSGLFGFLKGRLVTEEAIDAIDYDRLFPSDSVEEIIGRLEECPSVKLPPLGDRPPRASGGFGCGSLPAVPRRPRARMRQSQALRHVKLSKSLARRELAE